MIPIPSRTFAALFAAIFLYGCAATPRRDTHRDAAREVVVTLGEAGRFRSQYEAATSQVYQGVEMGYGITREEADAFAAANAEMLASIDWNELAGAIARVYMASFSEEELRDLLIKHRSNGGYATVLQLPDDFKIRLREEVERAIAPQLARRQAVISAIAEKRDSATPTAP